LGEGWELSGSQPPRRCGLGERPARSQGPPSVRADDRIVMSTAAAPRLAPPRAGAGLRARPRSLARPRPELALLLIVAGVLDLWALGRNGWANEYYSAAVRSMSTSWHDFLYGSFDLAGVMTVDKPPLALWVQALSARIFGFHPLSVLVPQALMGVAAVALVYDLVRRRFGRSAGFVAGLGLALTPASSRPWISGTADNSVWSLIFGYNGLGRLSGQAGGPGGMAGGPGGGGGGGNGLFGGATGPFRLLNEAMGAQAGWFLGFAL